MAQTIDTRPQWIEIKHYGGDTLVLNVITSTDFSTHTWAGQIRKDHVDATPDASFTFGTATITGNTVTLTAADSTLLLATGVDVTEEGKTFKRYSGIFDIQVTKATVVNTLVRGTITVDTDITRTP